MRRLLQWLLRLFRRHSPARLSPIERDKLDWYEGKMLRPLETNRRTAPAPKPHPSASRKRHRKAAPKPEIPKLDPIVNEFLETRDSKKAAKLIPETVKGWDASGQDHYSWGLYTVEDFAQATDRLIQICDKLRPFDRWSFEFDGALVDTLQPHPGWLRRSLRTGVFVSSHCLADWEGSRIIDLPKKLPYTGTVAFTRKEREGRILLDASVVTMTRLTCLPPQVFPLGPGVAWRMDFASYARHVKHKKRRGWYASSVYVLLDDDGQFYDTAVARAVGYRRVRCTPSSEWWSIAEKREVNFPKIAALCLRTLIERDRYWQVLVKRHYATILFSMDYRLVRRVFNTRQTAKRTRDGRNAAILHFVQGHQRQDGSFVKMHLRGERKFRMFGCGFEIIVPGKHRLPKDLEQYMMGYGQMLMPGGQAWWVRLIGHPRLKAVKKMPKLPDERVRRRVAFLDTFESPPMSEFEKEAVYYSKDGTSVPLADYLRGGSQM